jgi:hypothetical protein
MKPGIGKGVAIVRRPVKHARLRVREDQRVELIAPNDFTAQQIDVILERKSGWIEKQQQFFREHPRQRPASDDGCVWLFGESYQIVQAPELRREVVVDRVRKVVRSGRPLEERNECIAWLKLFARRFLVERTAELARKHKLPYGRVFVRSQKTRWGNCSVQGNVSLNWRLVGAPEFVSDYVILHELVHTRVMNHSHRFWVHLRAICPDYKRAAEWLNSNRPED